MKKHLMHKLHYIFIPVLLLGLLRCNQKQEKKELPFKSKAEYEETMIESHRAFLLKEKKRIDDYIDSSGMVFNKTGTGLRYSIYQKGYGDTLKSGDVAVVNFQLNLLNGDTLYATEHGKTQQFTVDFDNVETGLHEGIKLLKVGDKAIFILPAHLAHGVTGDQAEIPSQATLVFDLELIAKK